MTRLTLILLGVVVVSTLLLTRQCSVISDLKNERENLTTLASQLSNNDSTEHFKNSYGQEVAKRTVVELSQETFRTVYKDKLDSIAKQVGAKAKRIAGLTEVNARLKVENLQLRLRPPDIIYITDSTGDSIRVESRMWEYGERYFNMAGRVINCESILFDSIQMEVPLIIVATWQRKNMRLFGQRRSWLPRTSRKEYEVRATSPNPMLKINDISSFTINKSK